MKSKKSNKVIKMSNKVINLFNIPEKQYSFQANVVDFIDTYNQGTQIIHISNIKVCINGIWLRVKHSREMGMYLDDKLRELNLKNGDKIEFDAILVSVNQTFGGIQQKDGYGIKIPYLNETYCLPFDYNGKITIRIGETIYLCQTKEQKYRYYIVELDRKSFNKEKDRLLEPSFLPPTETNDGYLRCVEELSFTDKRIDVLGEYKKVTKNVNKR